MSNFNFLSAFNFLNTESKRSEKNAFTDPRSSCFYARYSLETAIKWLYRNDKSLSYPYNDNLMALIHEPTFKQNLPPHLFPKILAIVKIGNRAAHDAKPISIQESTFIVKELWHFFCWLYTTYTPAEKQVKIGPFDESLLKQNKSTEQQKTIDDLKKLEAQLREKEKAAEEKNAQNKNLEEELKRVREELARVKKENEKKPDNHDYNENETREFFIDLLLREAGWDPDGKNVYEYEVRGMPYESGVGYADYVLWGDNGLPLAVVEAKKTKVSPEKGRKQAGLYADCLEKMTGQRPIIFYTNGYTHYIWDDKEYPPRKAQGFFSKDQLQTLINRRQDRISLKKLRVNEDIAGRYYQIEAIKAVCQHFEQKERKALIVMATGAGKTRTTIGLVDVLLRHNWAKRVLFLADRIALVDQAAGAFRHLLPNTTIVDLTREKEDLNSRIMVSTYPTIMGLIDDMSGNQKRFGPGFFDLIVIDEAHRSVYKKYGAIFEYFDALLLGLTATPRDESDRDTYRLFELQPGVPTYFYELDQAILDKYLVEAKGESFSLNLPHRGLTYNQLDKSEQEHYEELFYDDENGSVPDAVEGAAFNQWLFNIDTVDNVLKILMEQGIKIEGGDKLGKTIIFARNHDHAEFILERFNKNHPRYAGHFAAVIDNYIKYADKLRKDFAVAEKMPQIAISVDMLDTGIDIHEIVNLVFFKPVYSKVKFLQMLGRGTRTCENLFGPGKDKEHFYVFDFCDNFEFFKANPKGIEAQSSESLSEKLFKRKLEIAIILTGKKSDFVKEEGIIDEAHKKLRIEFLDSLHKSVSNMNTDNFIVRAKREYVDKFNDRKRWNDLSSSDIHDISSNLAGLPTELPDEEENAKRFDLLMLNIEIAILRKEASLSRYIDKVKKLMRGLEEKSSIPMVKKELELIHDLQRDEYWQDITVPMVDQARRRIRDLVQYIDHEARERVYSDFEDEIIDSSEIENPLGIKVNLPDYIDKVKQFIKDQEKTIVIQKLKKNIPVTKNDIEHLEEMLFSSYQVESREKFESAFGKQDYLGIFIRKLVGLDRNAAKEAFSEFIQSNQLSTTQIRFVDLIINYLTQNGTMEIGALYDRPFTDLNDSGLDGVFNDNCSTMIEKILKSIDKNAGVAA